MLSDCGALLWPTQQLAALINTETAADLVSDDVLAAELSHSLSRASVGLFKSPGKGNVFNLSKLFALRSTSEVTNIHVRCVCDIVQTARLWVRDEPTRVKTEYWVKA